MVDCFHREAIMGKEKPFWQVYLVNVRPCSLNQGSDSMIVWLCLRHWSFIKGQPQFPNNRSCMEVWMLKIEITRCIHDGPTTYFTGLSSGRAGLSRMHSPNNDDPFHEVPVQAMLLQHSAMQPRRASLQNTQHNSTVGQNAYIQLPFQTFQNGSPVST